MGTEGSGCRLSDHNPGWKHSDIRGSLVLEGPETDLFSAEKEPTVWPFPIDLFRAVVRIREHPA